MNIYFSFLICCTHTDKYFFDSTTCPLSFLYIFVATLCGFLRRDHAERDYLVATLNAVIVGRKREKTHSVK